MRIRIYIVLAGSDVIETNTYQASVVGFMEHMGLSEEDSHGVIKNAVKLAKTACNKYFEEHPDEKSKSNVNMHRYRYNSFSR